MASRLYFPASGTAAVTPSSWTFPNQSANATTIAGSLARGSTTLATSSNMATGTTNPTHRGAIRYVYGPLAAQTISGTVKGQIRCAESNAGANATLGLAIKIIAPNGDDRNTLLNYTAADTFTDGSAPEMATSLTNRSFRDASENTSITLSSGEAQAGDYLVVEIGFRSATGTTRNITYRIGESSATELAEDETTTSDNTPWIEFSQTLVFAARPGVGTVALSGLAPALALVLGIGAGAIQFTGAAPTVSVTEAAIELRQGTTLVATRALGGSLTTALQTLSFALTTEERTAITDWSALRVYLRATARQLEVSWIQLETPGATAAPGTYTPGCATLAISGLSPPLQASIATGVGALQITGLAPTATVTQLVTPGVAALQIVGAAPTLTLKAVPGVASLQLVAAAPTLQVQAPVGTASVQLVGLAPTAAVALRATPGTGTVQITPAAPTLQATAVPGTGEVRFVGLAPTMPGQLTATPGPATVTLAPLAPATTLAVQPGTASVQVAGLAPSADIISGAITRTPGCGTLRLVGAAPLFVNSAIRYPLKAHSGGRYLTDQNDVPVLLLSDSPQGMLVACDPADFDTYFSTRAGQGFNASQVHIITGPEVGAGSNGETYDNVAPFTVTGDITTPNETYFARLDALVASAAKYGICLFLNAADTHVNGANHLWKDNGDTDCYTWGQFIGRRYRRAPHLVWMVGNDFQDWGTGAPDGTDSAQLSALQNVINGIQSVDTSHTLYTMWLDYFVSDSRECSGFETDCTLNFAYTYNVAYKRVATAYARSTAKPVFLGETHYEGFSPFESDNGTAPYIRRQNYWAMLAGACGLTYGTDNWNFHTGWLSDLSLTGATEVGYLRALFTAYGWQKLTPDTTNTVLTAGMGTEGTDGSGTAADPGGTHPISNTYAVGAIASDDTFAFVYIPGGQQVTIDLSEFAGTIRARWFDPTTGNYTAISTYSNSGTQTFQKTTTHSDGLQDWVLVLDVQDVSATPGVGSVQLAGAAPTLTQTITPGTGTLRLDALAPTVLAQNATAALYQGDTLVATRTLTTDLTTALQTFAFELSAGERAAITHWNELRVVVTANSRQLEVSWVQFQTPAASTQNAYTSTGAVQVTGLAPTARLTTVCTPDTGTVRLDALAPTATVTSPSSVTPGVGALQIVGLAPTLTLAVAPSTGEVRVAGLAPSLGGQILRTPDTATVTLAGAAPALAQTIIPGAAALQVVGFAPTATVTAPNTVAPGTGALQLEGLAPALALTVVPGTGALEIAPQAPQATITSPSAITPGVGTIALQGAAPALVAAVSPEAGVVQVTGAAPTLALTVAPGQATLQIVGLAPTATVTSPGQAAPLTGTITLEGFAPTLALKVTPGVGAVQVTGLVPSSGTTIPRTPGTASLQIVGLAPALTLAVAPETGTVVLEASTPALTLKVAPGAGTLQLTGLAPTRWTIWPAAPGAGSVQVVGLAPALRHALTPDAGVLRLDGQAPDASLGGPTVQSYATITAAGPRTTITAATPTTTITAATPQATVTPLVASRSTMAGLDVVNEKSSHVLTVAFFNEAGAAITPTSATYRIDAITEGQVVQAATAIGSLDTTVTLHLTPAQNASLSSAPYSERAVTVEWAYSGTRGCTTEYRYRVKNLVGIM